MIKRIQIPSHLRHGVRHMKKGYPKKVNLIVADTETVLGDPYTIQLFDGHQLTMSYHEKEDITKTFIKYISKRVEKDAFNLVYFHGLDFDMPVMLHDQHHKFIRNRFMVEVQGAKWDIFCGKFTFGYIYIPIDENKSIPVNVYDTFRFTFSSLANACKDLDLAFQKMERPEYLGKRRPTENERPYFEEYAKADVYSLWELAQWILARCREYDCPIPISLAHFASILLRHKFMETEDKIVFPPLSCAVDSILSYHGGKNGLYIDTPILLKEAYSYDIISAYPWAMSVLPSFLQGGKYVKTNTFVKDKVGIYNVDGDYKPCNYCLLYDHKFKTLETGPIENKAFTSFEIIEALRYNHLKIRKISGHYWEPGQDRSPLRKYVDFFYKLKKESKPETSQYYIAKILLNALYGKFIQTINLEDDNESLIDKVKEGKIEIQDVIYKAGGLFNPFIASLITGAVRAKLHHLEHTYQAIHASTDSILTLTQCNTGKGLGDLKLENKGPCLLIRNKVYIHFKEGVDPHAAAKNIVRETEPEKLKKLYEKYIYKSALHGFQADTKTLITLWKTRENTYKITRMVKIRESFKNKNLNQKPLMFYEFEKELEVDWSKYHET